MNTLVKNSFERKQKGAVSTLWIICTFFFVAVCFYSCSEKMDTDPKIAILGKWELIGIELWFHKGEMQKIDPNGSYIEFLSNGIRKAYFQEKDEFRYNTYKIDDKFVYFNHEKTIEQGLFIYQHEFRKNQLKMTYVNGLTDDLSKGEKLYYQRKK